FRFTTPDPFVYSLLRGDDSDRILRDTVSGAGGADAVFEAPLLQEFAVLGEFLAVVMLDELAAPTLSLVRMSDGSILQVPTPVALTIRSVRGSTQSNLLGYIVEHSLVGAAADDESGVASTLFVYDLSDASGVAMEITGIGGAPLTVVDWSFVPGTGSIVAHGDDQQLYLINPLISADAAPLGQHAELRGFVPGTARLIVADLDGGTVLDLAAGTNEPITLPEPDLPPELLPGKQVFLTDDSFFHLRNRVDYQTSTVSTSLYVTDARGTRQVFAPSGGSGRILDYCLSPNAEFLAVEVVSAEGVPDGYPVKTGFSATSVHLVRVDDALGGEAQTERLLNGFAPDWCGR
ncbi:MAG TPA: hypothetical protein PK890_10475, partial [Terrimesophilobacter sp.]|nr:hypothetical protein [Terrimesophilobacter sp.]